MKVEHIVSYVSENVSSYDSFKNVKALSFLLTGNNFKHTVYSGYVQIRDSLFCATQIDHTYAHYWIEIEDGVTIDLCLKRSFESAAEYHWDLTRIPSGIFKNPSELDFIISYFGRPIQLKVSKEEYKEIIYEWNDNDPGPNGDDDQRVEEDLS